MTMTVLISTGAATTIVVKRGSGGDGVTVKYWDCARVNILT